MFTSILRLGFLLLALLLSVRVCHAQTLEIHQIAVGNADAALIIVRDTTRVQNLFKQQIGRELLNPAQNAALTSALIAIKFDDVSDNGLSTRLFKYQLARTLLTPDQQTILDTELARKPAFDAKNPDLARLSTDLTALFTNPNGTGTTGTGGTGTGGTGTPTDPPINYTSANNALTLFDTRWLTLFPDRDAYVNMTQLAFDKGKTHAVDYNLAGSVKHVILVDIGRPGATAHDAAAKVNKYMKAYGVSSIDEFILSHYHNDHYGGFSAFVALNPTKFITDVYEAGYDHQTVDLGTKKKRSLFGRLYVDKLADAIQCANVTLGKCTHRKIVVPGTVIDLAPGIKLTAVAASGFVYGETPVKGTTRGGKNANDYSLAWVLTYKDFRYFTGGDLSGMTDGGYNDIETSLAPTLKTVPALKGLSHICAFKVSHHGSSYSSNEAFLDALNPLVAVIPNGGKDVHGNPDQQVFHRLAQTDSLERIYTLGMMQEDAVFKTRQNKKTRAYIDDIYTPWKSIGTDLVTSGKVIVSGNTYIVTDDANLSAPYVKFVVHWDGERNYEPTLEPEFVHDTTTTSTLEKHTCQH